MTDHLIDAWLAGTSTDDTRSALAARMRADPTVRRDVATQAMMHGVLRAVSTQGTSINGPLGTPISVSAGNAASPGCHHPFIEVPWVSTRISVADRVMARLPPGNPPRSLRWRWPVGLVLAVVAVGTLVAVWPKPRLSPAALVTASATTAALPVVQSPRSVLLVGATRSVVLVAQADAHVDAEHRDARLGKADRLRIGGSCSAYLRFKVPTGGSGRGRLVLTLASGSGPIEVHRVVSVGTWEESELPWWHRPTIGDRLGLLQGQGESRVLMLSLVPGAEVEFALVGDDKLVEVFSRESGQRGPQLEIEVRSGQQVSDF